MNSSWNMKKENFNKLNNILQQYNKAEELYTKSCLENDEQKTWERKNDLDSIGELLVVTVADILNDERDNIK